MQMLDDDRYSGSAMDREVANELQRDITNNTVPNSQGVEAKVPSCPHCKQPMTEYPASTFGRWWCDNFTSCEGKKARAK